MKTFLLSAFAVGVLSVGQLAAQCTPGNINVDFQPTINTSIPAGTVGQAYNTTILFKAPVSLNISVSSIPGLPTALTSAMALLGITGDISVDVSSMSVNGISGQPSGLTGVTGGGSGGSYNAGQQGCIGISGTPTQGGNFTITLDVEYIISIDAGSINPALASFGTIAVPQPVPSPTARTYNMSTLTGIEEMNASTFSVIVAPNPFSSVTNIAYTAPQAGQVELNVYNLVGGLVYSNKFEAKQGKNAIEFSADKLTSGLYIYSLTNGKETRTGKMNVTK